MFAVIKTGGKQYRVSPRDVIRVERLSTPSGEVVELSDVLAMDRNDGLQIGQPLLDGVRVAATVLEHCRDEKIIVFKKLRRKNHRRTRGHKQQQTVLRIEEILAPGEKHIPKKVSEKSAKKTATKAPKKVRKDKKTSKNPSQQPKQKMAEGNEVKITEAKASQTKPRTSKTTPKPKESGKRAANPKTAIKKKSTAAPKNANNKSSKGKEKS